MNRNPVCPVCNEPNWQVFDRLRFTPEMNEMRSDYERSRMQVLFDLWCPGATEVSLSSILCGHCGYATYRPRPTAEEVHSKYEFQKKQNPHQGVNQNRDALRLDRKRAWKVFYRLKPFLPKERLRILDYGAGDGKLMEPFLLYGCECFAIDYNEHPVPGVTHLGCDVKTLPQGEQFDLILCSHVIEHLAEPAQTMKNLVSYLNPGGVFYAEVPEELFGGIPIERDPVTHIGFFCRQSLEVLLEVGGLRVLAGRAGVGTYNERSIHIVWVVGQKTAQLPDPDFRVAAKTASAALRPSFYRRLLRLWHPCCLWGEVRRRFHYHHPTRKFFRRWSRRIRGKVPFAAARF